MSATIRYPARVRVTGYAASELEIQHEVLECGDALGRLVSQWTGSHVVVFDAEHAAVLAKIAREWSNGLDYDLTAGRYDNCSETKRQHRAAMQGLSTLSLRLGRLAA